MDTDFNHKIRTMTSSQLCHCSADSSSQGVSFCQRSPTPGDFVRSPATSSPPGNIIQMDAEGGDTRHSRVLIGFTSLLWSFDCFEDLPAHVCFWCLTGTHWQRPRRSLPVLLDPAGRALLQETSARRTGTVPPRFASAAGPGRR